jgi:hypothetical protein
MLVFTSVALSLCPASMSSILLEKEAPGEEYSREASQKRYEKCTISVLLSSFLLHFYERSVQNVSVQGRSSGEVCITTVPHNPDRMMRNGSASLTFL